MARNAVPRHPGGDANGSPAPRTRDGDGVTWAFVRGAAMAGRVFLGARDRDNDHVVTAGHPVPSGRWIPGNPDSLISGITKKARVDFRTHLQVGRKTGTPLGDPYAGQSPTEGDLEFLFDYVNEAADGQGE